ncbi:raffinose synthase Sip1-like protein [Scopulibacillus darangshiensis]|uniref:Raffinose synthase Sip1-like protein n=1 Tax=Scopulibacillus darangshiensis TaxID=442528 RepID=A0A4R2P5I3_9BACL|nr:Sip1-related alpha-galactosidase [Scopulibacillus darangshiensis]TCP29458.1 raffinose synthase Sip1-like protein [Scopulibacillus darangshiensis]
MFEIQQLQDGLHVIADNQTLFEGVKVSLTLDGNDKRTLLPSGLEKREGTTDLGNYTEYICEFNEENGGNQAIVNFRSFYDLTVVHVTAELEKEKLFKKQPSFAANHAVTITLNSPVQNYQLLANYQHKSWWTRPFFGDNLRMVPEKTQSLLLKMANGYHHVLPVVDGNLRTELAGGCDGLEVSVSPFQGGFRSLSNVAFILGSDTDPFQLVDANVKRAASVIGQSIMSRQEKTYPEILDYLGWCSWDAFYHDVNEQGLFAKAEELQTLNLPAKWIMIDDGWSEVRDNKLFSFEADKNKFPNGLSFVTQKLKSNFGINWVGVWHTIAGYWDGVHPESSIAADCRQNLYQTNQGALVPVPEAEKGFGFWHQWHKKLREDGIDFVKVDSQSAIANFFEHELSIGEAAAGAHTALEASCSLHFNNTVINCMGMAAENIWHRPYSSVSRNSDDFVPENKNGFREHALQNAYNSLYHGPFYWGDWDMYWSRNHDDQQNMILRAVSGGPIYISDKLEKTNADLVRPLVYKDGRIIRCDRPGMPTKDCLMQDPISSSIPLKIWNRKGDTGVIATFNISEAGSSVHGAINPQDIPGLDGEDFILYDVLQKTYETVKKDETKDISLEKDDAAIYLVVPADEVVNPLGLINKLIPSDSILEKRQNGQTLSLLIKEGGSFAFVSMAKVSQVWVNGRPVETEGLPGQESVYVIDCEGEEGTVRIDIAIKN